MPDYLRLDTEALEADGLVVAYQRAATLDAEAKAKQSAYRDELAVRLADEHGPTAAADMLGTSPSMISKHRRRHKERTMPHVITRAEDPTRLPAISHMHKQGDLHVEVIGHGGPAAQAVYPTTTPEVALDELVAEIAPWLAVLDALTVEAAARTAQRSVTRALDAWEAAEGVREERYQWKELQEVVARYQTPADVAAAHQTMDTRGLTPQQQEEAAAAHIADRVAARLTHEADQAHQRAVAATPGPIPELALWTTPQTLGQPARKLNKHLAERLAA